MIGGKHVGAASNICRRIFGMTCSMSSGGTASAFVMTACKVNAAPEFARQRSLRVRSIAVSVSFMPCFALNRIYTRRSLRKRRVNYI